jgi:tetratricopeptide (TPR) repeat protein
MKAGRIAAVTASAALALLFASGGVLAKDQQPKLYPNATRAEPKLDLTDPKESNKLNEALDAISGGDEAQAEALLQPFADGSASKSRYAQALALQGLANLKYNSGDIPDAINLLKNALDIGVMPNDTYYQLMYELAQFYVANQQYSKGLEVLTKWRTEGKRETADSYALEGNIDYRLEKYPEAIAAINKAKSIDPGASKESWDQILAASYAESGQTDQALSLAKAQLAKDPNDVTTRRNAVSMLVAAQKYPEALQMMEEGRAMGVYKDASDWLNLAKVYLVVGQNSDDPKTNADKAIQVLDEGLTKGILQPGYDVYKLQGDAANIGSEDTRALAYYKKAVPYAKDGEAELRMGQILINQGKYSDGKAAVKSAIAKGVAKMGPAYMLLGAAEASSKNRNAAIAAMRKATQYPETKAKAEAWLHKAGTH